MITIRSGSFEVKGEVGERCLVLVLVVLVDAPGVCDDGDREGSGQVRWTVNSIITREWYKLWYCVVVVLNVLCRYRVNGIIPRVSVYSINRSVWLSPRSRRVVSSVVIK